MKKIIQNKNKVSDIKKSYYIRKEINTYVDMRNLINKIISYVQNNKVYFWYDVRFIGGVLVFGLIGTKQDLEDFLYTMGKELKKYNVIIDEF